MKKWLFGIMAIFVVPSVFAQGYVNFDNLANPNATPGVFPGAVKAPFYNVDPAAPGCEKTGNTADGIPAGSQTYGGLPLFNDATHSYTVTLWALNSANVQGNRFANNLELVGTTTMRTSTSGSNAGRVASLPTAAPVPSVMPNSSDRATFQIRAWNNRGSTITTWDQVLADATFPRGVSELFTVPYALGTSLAPVNLEGLTSFQLSILDPCPEPSIVAIGLLGAGLLLFFRRASRKATAGNASRNES